jgi:hypothetical protein
MKEEAPISVEALTGAKSNTAFAGSDRRRHHMKPASGRLAYNSGAERNLAFMKILTSSLACLMCLGCLPVLTQEIPIQKLQLPTPAESVAAQVLAAEKKKYELGASTQQSLDKHQQDYDRAKASGPIEVAGLEIQRDGSTIHLKGSAEIRTSDIVLQADEADYHVATGAIEARGNVRVRPISR